jgi:hypothetical protein
LVLDQLQAQQMMRMMLPKRYPEYAAAMGTMDLSGVVIFKVTPDVISVLDYSKGFGHADLVTVSTADRAAA